MEIKVKFRDKQEKYRLVVAIVKTKDVLGNPQDVRLLYDEQSVNLEELQKETGKSPEFITCFIPKKMIKNELQIGDKNDR